MRAEKEELQPQNKSGLKKGNPNPKRKEANKKKEKNL